MIKNHYSEQKLLDAILRAKKDRLTVDEFVTVAEVLEKASKDRLLKHITWFLMVTVASTFVLWTLSSMDLVHLSTSVVDKITILFCAQVASLLAIIVTNLARGKPR